jgi:hypothetical protein
MRFRSGFVGLVVAGSLAVSGFSQEYAGTSAAAPVTPPPGAAYPAIAGPNLSQQLLTLTDQPATHSGFRFDKNMLQVAQGVLEANGMDAKRAAIALKGISYDNYRFRQPAFYTPEAMAALIDSYHAAGWKHLVNANQTPASTAEPQKTVTDMWLHFSGADVDGVTVLTRSSHMMNVVQVSCDLRPMDLMHLGGHFGIPKVDPSAVMVPAPR